MNFEEVTYNNGQCICEHPRIILNPLFPELMARYGTYYMYGRLHRSVIKYRHLFKPELAKFNPHHCGIDSHNHKECYFVDEETGDTFPMYIEVPCDQCDVCQERKVNAFVQRMHMEAQSYNYLPWFVTLTYDNAHLPKDGVQKRDVQLFWKRFRINMERAGYTAPMRYVLCGHYGKNTQRPHYHAIIYNIHSRTHKEWFEVKDIMQRSWDLGEVRRPRLVDCTNSNTFYYTARYLYHECPRPKGSNKEFVLSSNGHGGIGSSFIDSKADELRKSLNNNFQYLDKWTGKVKNMVFSRYVLNRVFPSWCRSVPSDLRRALADFSLAYSVACERGLNLFNQKYTEIYEKYKAKFSENCFFGKINLAEFSNKDCSFDCEEVLMSRSCTIDRYITRIDFREAKRLSELRNKFIYRLFKDVVPIDISARAYKIRQMRGLALARLQL